MDDDKILEITSNIEKALGEEAYGTIADSIGELLTGNTENMKALADRDAEIDKLKDRNEKLVSANGALLQKIPMERSRGDDEEKTEKKAPSVSLKDAFDSKGNFIR
jgi:hypothetical protein